MTARSTYDRLAPVYDRIDLAELTFKRPLRQRLFEGLSGHVLDAGCGTGANIPFYPKEARVVGLDVSPAMLARARHRPSSGTAHPALVAGDLVRAPFADNSFDAVAGAFLFGVIDDALQRPALAELARICKPTGEIRLLDHCYSSRPLWRIYMTLWLPWERLVYGGGFRRPTAESMPNAGLRLVKRELVFKDMVQLLVARPA